MLQTEIIMKTNHLLYFLNLCFYSCCLIGCGRSVPLREQFKNIAAGPDVSLAHKICSEYAEAKVYRKRVTLEDIDEYKVGSSCRYLYNTSHLRIIRELDENVGVALLCNAFGCSPETHQIILPHPITSPIINIADSKYCIEESAYYPYPQTIILSFNRKYSLRERKNMLREKQKELDERYLEELVHEYNTCYKTRTDW